MKLRQSISLLFFLIFLLSFAVKAQEFNADPGITPDSPFYFIDSLFETGSDNPEKALEYKDEKIAEALAMAQKGKEQYAQEALDRAQKYGALLEKEVTPDMEAEILQHSEAVETVLGEIQQEGLQDDIKTQLDLEKHTRLAAQVAGKIKQLCETLAELDPQQYEQLCKTTEDSPQWHKKLDHDLTEEQKQEARKFMEIMKQCFKTSGVECRCADITFQAFAERCSIIAPLAAACEVEGKQEACIQLEKATREQDPFELLPEYLQEAVKDLDQEVQDTQYERHFPRECQKAGVTTKEECMKIMFKAHAPEECVQALEAEKIQFTSMREVEQACKKIMFETNAPKECTEKGITNPDECAKLMFQLHAPQQCKDAGLTGEERSDRQKCEEIMSAMKQEMMNGFPAPAIGRNCNELQNPEGKLQCLQEFYRLAQQQGLPAQGTGPGGTMMYSWPIPCKEANALTPESCKAIMMKLQEETQPTEEEKGEESANEETAVTTVTSEGTSTTSTETSTTSGETSTESSETSNSGSSESSETSESSGNSTSNDSLTGGVIGVNNRFLRYFFGW